MTTKLHTGVRPCSVSLLLTACAALLLPAPAAAITFTEVMYDPPGTGEAERKLKFIEIFNDSATTVDISGFRFAEGVQFEFSPGTLFAGRSYLVICADQATIQVAHGITNTDGDFGGNLSEDGDELILLNESGGIAARVDFRDRGKWTSVPRGTSYSLSLVNSFADPDRPENWVPSRRPGGSPGKENFAPPTIEENEFFGEVSPWRYVPGWDGTAMAPFSDPPEAWRAPEFDDAGWAEGETGIGFAGNDDRTVLDMKDKFVAFAARKRFTVLPEVLNLLESAELRVRVDDGFVVYLNGEELGRVNVGNDVLVTHDKPAIASRSSTQPPVLLPVLRDKLRSGENVLAVQVHNRSLADVDASFIPSLIWRRTVVEEIPAALPLRINEVLREPGPGGGERWVEIHNQSDAMVPLEGLVLTDDPDRRDRYVFLPSRNVLPRGFLTLGEEALGFSLEGLGPTRELRLYLLSPNGAVADAAIIGTRASAPGMALSQGRLPDGRGQWVVSTTPTPAGPNTAALERDVVINEIMYHPLTGPVSLLPDGRDVERGEYIELHNRSDRTIPLEGWALTEGYNFVFPPGTALGPRSFLVLGPDPEHLRNTYGLAAEAVLGPEPDPSSMGAFGSLSNDGEVIHLEDRLGNTVQEVRYHEGGDWSIWADGGGSSLELIDPSHDNTVPSAWEPSDETAKAPWKEYTYSGPHAALSPEAEFWIYLLDEGECLIDEVSAKSTVEHIPNGSFENASTTPWRIDGTHIRSKRTTAEAHGGAACLHLIASGGGDNRVNRVEVDSSPRLPGGQVTVSFWARWLRGCQRLHTSGYNNNSLAVNHILSVPDNLGTPGKENSATARLRQTTGGANLGPVASEVRHLPAVPAPGQPITVLARITDPDGVREARVEYRLGRRTAPVSTVPLHDDGQNGDGEPGDGLFAGTIPGQANLAKVLFNVTATDETGQTRSYPPDAPAHLLLFQAGATYESPALRYRVVVDDENLALLASRRLHSDDLLDAAFVFEESEVYYNVGIRYHGSPWNRPPDPKMFRVRFRDDKPLRGYDRINISRYGSAPNEGVAYELCRLASGGEAARTAYSPRYNYIKVYYNGRAHSGSTALGEIVPPSGDYFRDLFPHDPDGLAYKITGKLDFDDQGQMTGVSWTSFRYYGPTKESFRYFYNPSTRGVDDDFDPLMRFLTILDPARTPLAKFEDPREGIESICNVEAFLRVFIIRVLHDDWDTIGISNGQNAYIYYAPVEGRFYLLPWDMDHTFGDVAARLAPAEMSVDAATRRWVNDSPKYRRTYMRIMKEFTSTFWTAQAMTPWLDAVAAEMKGGLVAGPAGIKSYMTARLNTVRGRIPQLTRVVRFAITTPPGGRDTAVKGREALLVGTAPLEIARIDLVRDGEEPVPVEPTWVGATSTDWRLTVSLIEGKPKTTFQLLGYTSRNEQVDDVPRITIYDSTSWTAPSLTAVEPARGPLEGGTEVTIRGEGFQTAPTVTFGGKPASSVVLRSATEIVAITPSSSVAGPVDVRVANLDGQSATLAGGYRYGSGQRPFIRGDTDLNTVLEIADPIQSLSYQFQGTGEPPCLDAVDVNDDGEIGVSDPIYMLNYLFNGQSPPPSPFPEAGEDLSPDTLEC